MRYPILTGVLAACAALVLHSAAAAQVRIDGRVVDNQSLEPISGVEVRVSRASGRTLSRLFTDGQGRFTFTADREGGYVFNARRLGYEETDTPVLWTDGFRVYQVEIRLDPEAVLLAPIEVLARSRVSHSPVHENFEARLASGFGHYFTQDDIERLKPSRVTDLIARVPGVRLQSSGAGHRRTVYMARGNTGCQAAIFVDGFQWNRQVPGATAGDPGFTIDDAVSPASVLGIEVYRGLATVPAEFLTHRARCGVVAIWTRRR